MWTRTFGGVNHDYAYSVAQTADGGYIVTGITLSFGAGEMDAWLIKTDASGDTIWTRTYGGAYDDEGWSVAQTAEGGYIIAGTTFSFDAGGGDVWLIKTDATGDTIWTRAYGGTDNDEGRSVAQTADGGYVITGCTASFGAEGEDVWLIRTDASGDTLWTRTFGGYYSECGYSVAQTDDAGFVIVVATSSFGAGLYDAWLIKTNASGDTLWSRVYGGWDYDYGLSVAQTTDGGYVIGGDTESFGAGWYDFWLIKTDSLGMVGIAEPKPPAPICHLASTILPRARLLTELRQTPDLALFDASGRQVLDPTAITPGILFLRSAATTRRILVVE
jgi:hypothetical protein